MRFRFFLLTMLFVLATFDSGCKAATATDESKDVATPVKVTAPSAAVDASASPSVSPDATASAPTASVDQISSTATAPASTAPVEGSPASK